MKVALYDLPRRLCAEALGSALLLATVVGSGVMGERLSGGNVALALLANTLATGAGLTAFIWMFGPISGAPFNPAVSLIAVLRRDLTWRAGSAYVAAQIVGAVAGVWTAHAMFGMAILEISTKVRGGPAQMLSEFIAAFGLIGVILATARSRPDSTPMAVGLYITAAYWFTASTAFANPAVTLARSLTDSFAGIAPANVAAFILAQVCGALAAVSMFGWLLENEAAR